jgi:hypothetical protein
MVRGARRLAATPALVFPKLQGVRTTQWRGGPG